MIHQYKLGDLCVVLDVCSGSVHAVDEVAYDMIAGFETQERETLVDALAEKYRDREDVTRSELEECYDQLLALKDAGKLFTEDTFAPMAGELKARTSGVIKHCASMWPTPATSTAPTASPVRASTTATGR